ncbi:MAG: ParA family protein [Candidatus Omnitrophica bacterium]|nr:ParA family protein [Candidatus Omnitrophota bacterium]
MQPSTKISKIVAVTNQKGGCGKTTTSINLAAALSSQNYKVLLVDLDPQAHCTLGLGIDPETLERTIFDILVGYKPNGILRLLRIKTLFEHNGIHNAILKTKFPNLDIIPSNILLSSVEVELIRRKQETILSKKLQELKKDYDFILIDCPPSLGIFTLNALAAADGIIIPVQTHYFALEGTRQLLHSVDIVRQRFNHSLDIMGIVATLHNENSEIEKEIINGLRGFFKTGIFNTVIKFEPLLIESTSRGDPIGFYAPDSQGARDYMELAKEVIEKC